jgi:hypothetical protein
VLVIIGLVVGGVLVGQDLIRAAQVRATISQIEKYKTAVMTFRDKYGALPGDMANATSFWPADPGCTVYGPTSASFRAYMAASNGLTCNGDGNGIIYGPSTAFGEVYLFWQQLALAGYMPGLFTGAPGDSGKSYTGEFYFVPNLNAPPAPMPNTMMILDYPQLDPGWATYPAQHFFWLGAPSQLDTGGTGNWVWAYWPKPILTPLQAQQIDTKYDDGYPDSGTIRDDLRSVAQCENDTGAIPLYQTNNGFANLIGCTLMFAAGF